MDRLQALFDWLKAGLGGLPEVNFCDLAPKRREELALPALVIELTELAPDSDPGTDQLALMSYWSLRVITSDEAHESTAWHLVQAVLFWLYTHPPIETYIGKVELKQAAQDHFSPDYPGHRVWLIEWLQRIRVGVDDWDGEARIPSEMLIEARLKAQE